MKNLTIILTLIPFLSWATEELPILLPPISPKQEASIEKEKAHSVAPITEEIKSVKVIVPPRKDNFNLERIELGVVRNSRDLYLPLASTLCLIMNAKDSRICRLKEYESHEAGLIGLMKGEIDLFLTNSLVISSLDNSSNQIDKTRLRFINYFFTEAFITLVKKDYDAQNFNDLQDISLNISSQDVKNIMKIVRQDKNWLENNDTYLSPAAEAKALCNGTIKVATFLAEILNQEVKDITKNCEIKMMKFTPVELLKITQNPAFFPYTLPAGTYLGLPQANETFGIKAVMISTSDLRNEQAKLFLKSLISNLKYIKNLHLAFANLTQENLFAQPLLQEHQVLEEFR